MTINGICKRCSDPYCFGGCIPLGYALEESKPIEGIPYHSVKVQVCNYPLCMFGGMGCEKESECEEKPKPSVKESYIVWRDNLSKSHWKLYTNMPNTLSEDAFAAGYLAGSRRRGSK